MIPQCEGTKEWMKNSESQCEKLSWGSESNVQ